MKLLDRVSGDKMAVEYKSVDDMIVNKMPIG
jgi:hypothetical protein